MVRANPIKIMKPRQLFIDVVKRTAASVTAAAMFVGPTGLTFASPSNHERQKSEHAVQRLRHTPMADFSANPAMDHSDPLGLAIQLRSSNQDPA
jgi:hypothetical protein